ncbi:MAG: hypothetical protein LUC32_07915, partial [Clostridiales bacterium]|nr:hypothetical protein [Clostridiales bacterium]
VCTSMTLNLSTTMTYTRQYSAVTPGDIDGDGDVGIKDLMQCLYSVSGRTNLTGNAFDAADVDGSSTVNLTDLMRMLYYVSGRSSTL